MQVKEAAKVAIDYVRDLFGDQGSNFRLEEVEFTPENKSWSVTVGFSRPSTSALLNAVNPFETGKEYKVVRINDRDGKVLSVKIRALNGAAS